MKLPLDFTLNTQHFSLRIPDESDLEFVFSTTQYPGFHDGMLWDPPKSTEELIQPLKNNLKSWKEGSGYSFTIETKEPPPERLGRITIRKTESKNIWNVGFWTHPKHQGKGIMTEALKAITDFGFSELYAEEITADYAIWNKASEKVLLKNGFRFSRHIEKGYFKNGKWESENQLVLKKRKD